MAAEIYLNVYLPGPRMKVFDDLLAETKGIYEKARGEDLLPPEMSRQAQTKLQKFETQGDDLRTVVYRNLSPIDIFLSFVGGHSSKIAGLSSDLMELRMELLTTSQKERARRREQLLEQARNRPMDHAQDNSGSPNSLEPTRDTTSTLSITDSTPPLHHFVSSIRSTMRWLSEMSAARNQTSSYPQCDVDELSSLPDIEARSRSSTLVEDVILKDSSTRRPWSFISRWFRSEDARPACYDLEARSEASIHDTWNASCETRQVDSDTVSTSI